MKLTIDVDDATADRLLAIANTHLKRVDVVASELVRDVLAKPLSRTEEMRVREARVRELHALGHSDPRIAEQIGLTAGGVRGIRERLNLPAVGRRWPTSTGDAA